MPNYKKRLRYAGWCLGVISLLIGLGPTIYSTINPKIQHIQVIGDFNYIDKPSIQKQTESLISTRFFDLNLKQLTQELQHLAWIESIQLKKKWPDTVYMLIVEHQPTAIWNQDTLLNAHGTAFKPVHIPEDLQKQLPKINGYAKDKDQLWTHFLWAQKQFAKLGLTLSYFSIDSQQAWIIQSNHVSIYLGNKMPRKKFTEFKIAYLNQLHSQWRRIKQLDFRYTHGVAVTFK